jgi:hypothetical protein
MPGDVRFRTTNSERARKVIDERSALFIVSLKGHCKDKQNVINFPPIFRNISFKTDRETIGDKMFEYLEKNNLPRNQKVRKLTQLLDTNDEFMTFNNYYLWFLIDTCDFVIDEIKELYVFEKHRAFNQFVEEFMTKRQEAKLRGDEASSDFFKNCMNGSYGYDIMNEENFSRSKILDKSKTFMNQMSPNFISTKKLKEETYNENGVIESDSLYQVQLLPKKYNCNTSIIQGFFTLDNAKFWYLNFIYNFMYKCLDMNRMHFIEGDTDSMYWAVSGNPEEDYQQGFKYVIKDEKFYNENVYKFFPSSFYSTDNSNPTFTNKLDKILFDKKLGGLAIEKQCESMIALAPKLYSCYTSKNCKVEIKAKGVSKSVVKELKFDDYNNIISKKEVKAGSSENLQLHQAIMSKIRLTKNFLTAAHTKYKVSDDFSTCLRLRI